MANIAENIAVNRKLFHAITNDSVKTAEASRIGSPGNPRSVSGQET